MPPSEDRWSRADRLFEAALDLDAPARSAFLDRECGDDGELRALVERLLAAGGESDPLLGPGGAMHGPLWQGLAAELARETGLPAGTLVGRWRIVGELGEGGMAVVHLAERADGHFAQKAALKLVKRGTDSAEVIGRFEQERQILAGFAHPGIARLLDGGVSPDGRPYFVLEHVQGRPIDAYSDERRLPIRARLELFLQVARAVEHAHRNLVVHRDIKPSNILVTAEGQAKLLDFGIARLLDASASLTLTRGHQRPMTPAYASPEQLRGASITTVSDVYQLGLLLFLLLTGRSPYQRSTSTPEALERAILDEEPTRPSVAVATSSPDVARARATTPARLQRLLDGDLDRILLKALRKEPERRYQGVGHLIDDVERYLAGRPVSARPDTLGYRLERFARRHWVLVTAGVLILLSLASGLVAAAYQARRAERRFQEVRKLSRALLFDVYDQIARLPGSTPAREHVIATSLAYLDSLEREAGDDPGLLHELAEAYERVGDVQGHPRSPNLGQRAAALTSYERALALRRRLEGGSSANPATTRGLARLHVKIGDVHESQARLSEALASLDAGLALARPLSAHPNAGADDFGLVVDALTSRGTVQTRSSDARGALSSYREALAVASTWQQKRPSPRARRALAHVHGRIGTAQAETGDLQASVESQRRAVALCEELLAEDPEELTVRRELRLVLSFLGNVLGVPAFMNLGQVTEATQAYRRVLDLSRELSAADPRDARARLDLANAYWRLGTLTAERSPAESVELLQRGLEEIASLSRAAAGDFDLQRRQAALRASLSDARRAQGQRDAAVVDLRAALEMARALAARNPTDNGVRALRRSTHRRLGDLLVERGDIAGALESQREGLRLAEERSAERPEDLYAWWSLADSYAGLGRVERAIALDRQRPLSARREAARASLAWHGKALEMWAGWGTRAPSTAFDQSRRAEAMRQVRDGEALVAHLERPFSPPS